MTEYAQHAAGGSASTGVAGDLQMSTHPGSALHWVRICAAFATPEKEAITARIASTASPRHVCNAAHSASLQVRRASPDVKCAGHSAGKVFGLPQLQVPCTVQKSPARAPRKHVCLNLRTLRRLLTLSCLAADHGQPVLPRTATVSPGNLLQRLRPSSASPSARLAVAASGHMVVVVAKAPRGAGQHGPATVQHPSRTA
eukprot:CAMPEP_0179011096 /NCGR_PEP_ID=MMETSP0796-20121207/483_1 /TAXON_ID=73915 /ORGANISM="Pyrodinium bahamense, Strain pbaha01" /LENGTH=198 /DNA_ID=CAMNT_0020706455 /DNA_START=68 /DNA_END=659 /DNA_ORIENTATION=+